MSQKDELGLVIAELKKEISDIDREHAERIKAVQVEAARRKVERIRESLPDTEHAR